MSSGLSKNRADSDWRSAAVDLLRMAAFPMALFAWLHVAASAIAALPTAATAEQISKLVKRWIIPITTLVTALANNYASWPRKRICNRSWPSNSSAC